MNTPTNTKPEILCLVSIDFNPPVYVHDGSDPTLTFQDTTYTGIGSVLKHRWEFHEYMDMDNGISRMRLSVSVPLRYGLMPTLLQRYINRRIIVTACNAKDKSKIRQWPAIVRDWRLSWNPLCITFQTVGLLEAMLADQYPYNPEESKLAESNIEPKLWIRLRRRILTLIEGEESHRRPLYWSHVDQQERHPDDMAFSQARKANSPLRKWWLEYRWVNVDNPAPKPKWAPWRIYWREFEYRRRSLIHPEWGWALKTRRGKHILRRILRWMSGQL